MTDRLITLSKSIDGGHNFVSQSEHSLGETGDFQIPVIRRRLGFTRSSMYIQYRVTSPIKADLIAVEVEASGEG